MKIRIIDYVANPGGGVRFTTELLRELQSREGLAFEVVSHGEALERYRGLLSGMRTVTLEEIPPRSVWRTRTLLSGVPGAGPLNWLMGTPDFHFEVDARALEDCDVAWFPWIHRHRIPWELASRVVASLHDVIVIEFARFSGERIAKSERITLAAWLGSPARIAVSSSTTAASVARIFGAWTNRVEVIPLSGQHGGPAGDVSGPVPRFGGTSYILCPANTAGHKNHEVLLVGAAGVARRHPIVLTGLGTNLNAARHHRDRSLRDVARKAGLTEGQTLFGVGYVEDAVYYKILDGAWALVMPTLAEGGGSFPVWEAMERGIPAVCSDIPVMREMVERSGGEVIWFDPHDAAALARALSDLEANYPRHKARAVAQVRTMRRRTWGDVAADYAKLMGLPPV